MRLFGVLWYHLPPLLISKTDVRGKTSETTAPGTAFNLLMVPKSHPFKGDRLPASRRVCGEQYEKTWMKNVSALSKNAFTKLKHTSTRSTLSENFCSELGKGKGNSWYVRKTCHTLRNPLRFAMTYRSMLPQDFFQRFSAPSIDIKQYS